MKIHDIPTVGDSGDAAADREPLHQYIRSLNTMLRTPQRGDTVRDAREQLEAWRDEAQARLDAHAAR